MITLHVRHHFSAGHRIPGLPGPGVKCAHLHGHTFGVRWTFKVGDLSATTFEFAAAKAVLRGWVDEHLDHGYLVAPDDAVLIDFLAAHGFKYRPVAPTPSTEAIASLLYEQAGALVPGVTCISVLVTEGPSNAAEVTTGKR